MKNKKNKSKHGTEFKEMIQLEEWYNKFDPKNFLQEKSKKEKKNIITSEDKDSALKSDSELEKITSKKEFTIEFPNSSITRAAILELSDELQFTDDIANNRLFFIDKKDMDYAIEKLDMAGIKMIKEEEEIVIRGDMKQDYIDDVSLKKTDSTDRSKELHGSMTQPFRPDAAGDIPQELHRMRQLAGVGINNPMY